MARRRHESPIPEADSPDGAEITLALHTLSENMHKLAQAQLEVAHHQRITNLIVLSQITTDPDEQKRLRAEAVARMNSRRLQ